MMYENNFYNSNQNNIPNPAPRRPKQTKGRSLGQRITALALSAVLFGGISAGTNYYVSGKLASTADATQTQTTSVANATTVSTLSTDTTSTSASVSDVAASGLTSVVAVTNVSVQEVQSYYSMFGFGMMGGPQQTVESTSVGSGVIIYSNDENLYMVSNYHVVEDATNLSVTFVDGNTYEATVCGYDEDRDIAVLRVSLEDLSVDTLAQITVAEVGSSDDLVVGEQVVAIGNALGYGQSVTTGVVSAVDRVLSGDDSDAATENYIQTDAAINPGNSGGALFNMAGQLIGINTAKISTTGVEGMGYSIPISEITEFIAASVAE